jgi:hypothetical protein
MHSGRRPAAGLARCAANTHNDRAWRGGDRIPDWGVVNPYWIERRWNAVKHRFEDLRFREDRYPLHFQVIEEQAAFVAARYPDLTGTDIGQAYMLAGLQIAMAVDGDLTCRLEGFTEGVWELAQRCLATCHPDHNPEVAALTSQTWRSDEDRSSHFMECGAVMRRLVDSTRFWAHRGPRAYMQHVTGYLREHGWDLRVDEIHFIIRTKHLPQ